MKFKMVATAGLSLRLDPYMYEKNVSKRFFSETTYACSLVSIVQVVSEKKRFETFFP
jgi:hypothetical protein